MIFGSVCSGIEAASVAWNPLGWKAAWFAEIEPFPSEVLRQRFPDVPNLGDMTKLPEMILNEEVEAPDLLCGGTPCQAFSVAGLRKSLDDDRGNLSLVFCEIANAVETVRRKKNLPPPNHLLGKRPPAFSTRKTMLLDVSWEHLLAQTFRLTFLQADGKARVELPERTASSRGERLTLNISESPNAASVSSLSQVLEKTSTHPRYFLSPHSCQCLLKRAEVRKKVLPPTLKDALTAVAKHSTTLPTDAMSYVRTKG